MNILHINASDVGSTGGIVLDICREAYVRGWSSVFLFPRRHREANPLITEYTTSLPLEQGIYRRIYYIMGLHYGFAPLSTRKILRIIRREKPDVVHLHSINCATVNIYRLVSYLKENNIPTVLTNHAEFFYTGNCPHAFDCDRWKVGCGNCPDLFAASDSKVWDRTSTAWLKMKEAFQGHANAHVVSVSPWVDERSRLSPILNGFSHHIILNGVRTDVFSYSNMCLVRGQLGFSENEKIILHVTANFSDSEKDNKGGRYLIKLARRLLGEKIRFIVIGKHAVVGEIPENMTLLGETHDAQLLAKYYCAANVCVVTSKRETFGMTVAEALCCGTPVVGFESGGSESIAIPEYSQFVSYGDLDALEAAVRTKWLFFKSNNDGIEISRSAINKYSACFMAKEYCDLYEKITEKGR